MIVAHPGHELRVHRWVEMVRPLAFVLTKGDGHHGVPRIASTTRVLEAAGARIGGIYGRLADADVYAALLQRDHALFRDLLDELVDALVAHSITCVAADAEEGYNPTHDTCRYLVAAAAAMAGARMRRPVRDLDFLLEGPPDACPEPLRQQSIRLDLDDDALARKLTAARNYPELQFEVARALAANGAEAFRIEYLRPARVLLDATSPPPFYEEYGERQVAAGHYNDVLRFRQHVLPVRTELWARMPAV